MTVVTNPAVRQSGDDSTKTTAPTSSVVPPVNGQELPLANEQELPQDISRHPGSQNTDGVVNAPQLLSDIDDNSGHNCCPWLSINPIDTRDETRHFRPGVRPDLVPECCIDSTKVSPDKNLCPKRPAPLQTGLMISQSPPIIIMANSLSNNEETVTQQEARRRLRFDDESKCDVIFVAGLNNDTYRYPAHRSVLAPTSPAFESLLNCKSEVIVVDYVDRRGFEQLMRYHYCEETQLNSVYTARCTLDAAYKFLCCPLVERCVRRLDEILDEGIALEILKELRYMGADLPGAASAPPPPDQVSDAVTHSLAMCSQWVNALAHNALLVLDDHADAALADERFEDLTYEDLSLVVKRPTFRVSDEFLLVSALHRWATAICKKHQRELTSANRRTALGELAYTPRYLLMHGSTLDRALEMELLEPVERKLVLAQARKLPAPVAVVAEQENMLRQWGVARPKEPAALPVALSSRSTLPEPRGLCGRRRRQKRQKQLNLDPQEKEEEGCCKCFGEGLLRAFICLFD